MDLFSPAILILMAGASYLLKTLVDGIRSQTPTLPGWASLLMAMAFSPLVSWVALVIGRAMTYDDLGWATLAAVAIVSFGGAVGSTQLQRYTDAAKSKAGDADGLAKTL